MRASIAPEPKSHSASRTLPSMTDRVPIIGLPLHTGTESLLTRRWSKVASNSRSHLRRDPCSAANLDRSFSSI
jgi:hypothetical protein